MSCKCKLHGCMTNVSYVGMSISVSTYGYKEDFPLCVICSYSFSLMHPLDNYPTNQYLSLSPFYLSLPSSAFAR